MRDILGGYACRMMAIVALKTAMKCRKRHEYRNGAERSRLQFLGLTQS
jgi:hypothetical protein